MNQPLYFDYAATTPVEPQVAEKMMAHLTRDGVFANPASRSHLYGWQAEAAVERARGQVAELIQADSRELVWTSGATEANNLALKGAISHIREREPDLVPHIITSAIEHKAVLDTCQWLQQHGCEVTFLPPDATGLISAEAVAAACCDNTRLVSLMHVNNEIGTIHDLAAIAEVAQQHGLLFHVDAAQSAGKLPIDLSRVAVDLMSFSAHKIYGPKGIGALFVRYRPGSYIDAQIHGGGHERGMRSGTLATHQIVGMGEAFALAATCLDDDYRRLQRLKQRLWQGFDALGEVYLNGALEHSVPNILNVSFAGVDGETLLLALRDLAVSSGSACTSASVEPSYVIKALGRSDALSHAAIRFSMGRMTTEAEVDQAVKVVCQVVRSLRDIPSTCHKL